MFSPYNFTVHADKVTFQTKRGVNYTCLFILDETTEHLGLSVNADIFHFVFFSEGSDNESSIKNDARIHQTIVKILQDFFLKNPEGIILYFCDDTDSKGKARHSLFEKWVQKYNCSTPNKVLLNLTVDQSRIHISLLLNENHLEMDKIHLAIQNQLEELRTAGKPFSTNIS